jgi:hypothetical protein
MDKIMVNRICDSVIFYFFIRNSRAENCSTFNPLGNNLETIRSRLEEIVNQPNIVKQIGAIRFSQG